MIVAHDRTGVVDYDAGNLKSVETALRYLGADFFVSGNPSDFSSADRLIFPGVGEAGAAMAVLSRTGLDKMITDFHHSGKPLLGICLGCQIVLSHSEEGNTVCLGLVDGEVKRFPPATGLKVPHMGWNQVTWPSSARHPLFNGIPESSSFYFVHSYYPSPADTAIVAGETLYGIRFASVFVKDNLCATQFHPEKSGRKGLRLLDNFLSWKVK